MLWGCDPRIRGPRRPGPARTRGPARVDAHRRRPAHPLQHVRRVRSVCHGSQDVRRRCRATEDGPVRTIRLDGSPEAVTALAAAVAHALDGGPAVLPLEAAAPPYSRVP